jgi:hypothetical protein
MPRPPLHVFNRSVNVRCLLKLDCFGHNVAPLTIPLDEAIPPVHTLFLVLCLLVIFHKFFFPLTLRCSVSYIFIISHTACVRTFCAVQRGLCGSPSASVLSPNLWRRLQVVQVPAVLFSSLLLSLVFKFEL